ncbi:hypothetical protein [Halorhabdus sp. CUG00001]|uniref:hypothetical protein n=1 Tax=Halorhabdus sp. CUG00001 TaxID=2600297 RepID=UPI00131E4792|nr:hypothetical protein [Halorhabdus sp. CUG00001]
MIFELVDSLGIDVGTWAILLVVAWYLFRGARAGRRAGSLLGRVVSDVVLLLVTAAVAMALGWADLDLPRILDHVSAGLTWLQSDALDMLSGVVG